LGVCQIIWLRIGPYLEQTSLYALYNPAVPLWPRTTTWTNANNLQLIAARPGVMVCPSDDAEAYSENTLVDPGVSIYRIPADARAAVGSYSFVTGTIGTATAANPTANPANRSSTTPACSTTLSN